MNSGLKYQQDISILDSNTSHVQIISRIEESSVVLDVGCACGDLGEYIVNNKNCNVYGIEYNIDSINIALSKKVYTEIVQIDLNKFNGLEKKFHNFFDVIVFGDVLEHLNNPSNILNKFLVSLKKHGKIIISLPNIAHGSIVRQLLLNNFEYMQYGILDSTHVKFFTSKSISSMLAENNLKINTSSKIIYNLNGLHDDKYNALPRSVFEFISKNFYSYVFQYVFDVILDYEDYYKINKHNLKELESFSDKEKLLIKKYDWTIKNNSNFRIVKTKTFIKKIFPKKYIDCAKKLKNFYKKIITKIIFLYSLKRFYIYTKNILTTSYEKKSNDFIDIAVSGYQPSSKTPRLITFYLPQFHPFPENDEWWGKGFTEWTNVTRAVPQFVGHYQPHLPIDLGFYDLRIPEVMERQIEIAKIYGIYGFCFHYYWFSGKRLMEKPLFDFLNNKELQINFCLCWANEPWSRRWDGSENELLIKQEIKEEDDELFFNDILPFLRDSRYIKIKNSPVIIIYRPHFFKKNRIIKFIKNLRESAKKQGFDDLYMIMALTHNFDGDPVDWGFNAGVEFPPHLCGKIKRCNNVKLVSSNFNGNIFDMKDIVKMDKSYNDKNCTIFKTVFPSWDNTARLGNRALIFNNQNPKLYREWLYKSLIYTKVSNNEDEQYVFINAWNEWAEGAHLEPDRRYGYAYLDETLNAIIDFESNKIS